MACGTPVVTSAWRGDGGGGGRRGGARRPARPEAIAAGIVEAEARREELLPLGLERARAFTWAHAADLVEALWRELA